MVGAPSGRVRHGSPRLRAGAKEKHRGAPSAGIRKEQPARASRARRSPGIENGVELQRVYVIARDILQAQLQVPADDVARTDAEHETIVVAEIVSGAADQLDIRRDQVPRYARGP